MTPSPRQQPPPAAKRPLPAAQPQATAGMLDEKNATLRFNRLKKRVSFQTWTIASLGLALVIILPFARPVYLYYALSPDKTLMRMTGMPMPNMTNRAVLAWATTSITEIMTMGFGDLDVKLPKQRVHFTPAGWEAYMKSFAEQKISEAFKQNQLVLTTVPSDTPVILDQGVNPDNIYQWVVQMPIIMTYATNDNVTSQKRAIVTLVIVRVPAKESAAGIAIQNWILN